MPGKPTQRAEIVMQYITRFPAMSKSSLADLILEKEPLYFESTEEIRFLIRYHTSSAGSQSRKQNRGAKLEMNFAPPSQAKKYPDYILAPEWDNIVWMSDLHFPNHDQKAVNIAVQYALDAKANTIILGGDVLDNEPFSAWEKKPSASQVRAWFDMVYEFLLMLRLKFPDALIVWLEGNHDQWYERWLIKKAPILFDDHYYKMENRLKLASLEILYLNQFTKMRIDDLYALHGHTLMRQKLPPVNAARGVFMRTKQSAIIGHVHSTSTHVETTLKGKMIACYSVACLCTLSPEYDPHNTKHNQGFAHITRKKGFYHVDNLMIIDGKIISKLL